MPDTTPRKRAPATPKPKVIPVVRRKMTELVPDPANVRRHDERQIEALQASLRRWGQPKPILIDAKDVIVAGNGLYEAARREGWDWIETRIFEGDPAEARAYAIADNRLGELSSWDDELLRETLDTLDVATRLDLGWSPDELDKLLAPPGDPDDDGGEPGLGGLAFSIVIECRDEDQQRDLLERLEAEGLSCRAVMA